ncbi:hypothetical protein QS257_02650 [Terrilactibacillus sp. S3-3]|nr:hypothetical protein QS257_02650 [Terrilactibacillus sp. S3-3]
MITEISPRLENQMGRLHLKWSNLSLKMGRFPLKWSDLSLKWGDFRSNGATAPQMEQP